MEEVAPERGQASMRSGTRAGGPAGQKDRPVPRQCWPAGGTGLPRAAQERTVSGLQAPWMGRKGARLEERLPKAVLSWCRMHSKEAI